MGPILGKNIQYFTEDSKAKLFTFHGTGYGYNPGLSITGNVAMGIGGSSTWSGDDPFIGPTFNIPIPNSDNQYIAATFGFFTDGNWYGFAYGFSFGPFTYGISHDEGLYDED